MSLKKLIENNYKEIETLIDSIKVGVFITDENGNVLILNKESEKSGGLSKRDQVGKNIKDLIEQGYIVESSVTKVLESKHEESIIQNLGDGSQVYITGNPVIKNREVELVVCTERDITETINLKKLLEKNQEITKKYKEELQNFRNQYESTNEIIANSFKMKAIIDKAMKLSKLNTTVLVTGESGTGKELLVKLIHKNSNRSEGPFIKINCAAIPENLLESEFFGYEKGSFTGASKEGKMGIFELANNGTLFLDEIGDLPLVMQAKMLRVLQERELMRIGGKKVIQINVRIIAATNKNLINAIDKGEFRNDLFYRLNVASIEIPLLKERKEDIRELALYFINQFNLEHRVNKTIEVEAIKLLEYYDWPGNVRELRNLIERTIINYEGNIINKWQIQKQLESSHSVDVKKDINITDSLDEMVRIYEKSIIQGLMEKYHKASTVAKILNVNKSTISKKIKKYGL